MGSLMESFRDAGPIAFLHLLLFLVGLIGAIVVAVLLGMKWKVPPILSVAPLLACAFLGWAGSTWATWNMGSLARLDPAERAAERAAAAAGLARSGRS